MKSSTKIHPPCVPALDAGFGFISAPAGALRVHSAQHAHAHNKGLQRGASVLPEVVNFINKQQIYGSQQEHVLFPRACQRIPFLWCCDNNRGHCNKSQTLLEINISGNFQDSLAQR
jgi:hypothetical protein